MAVQMNPDQLTQFLVEVFPQVHEDFDVMAVDEQTCEIALNVSERHLRPGNTVSGPSMFGLADVAAYLLILAQIGPKALAVTTNCSIDFMRKPAADKRIVAHGELLKLGRALAVVSVKIKSEGDPRVLAAAQLTYSIPPKG